MNSTKLEIDSNAAKGSAMEITVPKTHSPFCMSDRKVLGIGSCTRQHSEGLLTPCRQVGLSRKSPRNTVSPSTTDLNPSSTPRSSRFAPSVRNNKGLIKFKVNVFNTHTNGEETSIFLGNTSLENNNDRAKQCKYEIEKVRIHNKHEGRNEKKQPENFIKKGGRGSTVLLSCKVSDIQSSLHDEYNMASPGSGDGEMSTEKTSIDNLVDAQQFSVDETTCKDSGLQSFNLNDTNGVITSNVKNCARVIKADQIKKLDNPTQQHCVLTSFHKDSNFPSNSTNEDSMTNSQNMTECTEQNFKILKQQITAKEEEVKRLKLIVLYKKKHDVNELDAEIARWKEGCQEALRRLHKASVLQGHQHNMTQLIEMFGIPPAVVGYNKDTEDFD